MSNQHRLFPLPVMGAYWLYIPHLDERTFDVLAATAGINISDVSSSLLEFCSLTIQR